MGYMPLDWSRRRSRCKRIPVRKSGVEMSFWLLAISVSQCLCSDLFFEMNLRPYLPSQCNHGRLPFLCPKNLLTSNLTTNTVRLRKELDNPHL